MKRDILVGTMRAMPLPQVPPTTVGHVVEAVRAYFAAVRENRQALVHSNSKNVARESLLRVDAEILRLYDLPPRLERQLLDLFAGWRRPGVPFSFDRYFPEGFEPCFPLYEYLSEVYQRSTAGQLRARHENLTSPQLLAAFDKALAAFRE